MPSASGSTMPNSAMSQDTMSDNTEQKTLAGDLAIWFFICAELMVFAIFFIGYSWMKSRNPELFDAGQQTLHPIAGLINTIALITSSYVVALSVIMAKKGNLKYCKAGLWLSVLIAFIYVFSKLWEYSALAELGYGLSTNNFYMFYFFTTGFHFMHVLLGMVILAIIAITLKQPGDQDQSLTAEQQEKHSHQLSTLESGASYWHMVDLVWIILFPLIYVI